MRAGQTCALRTVTLSAATKIKDGNRQAVLTGVGRSKGDTGHYHGMDVPRDAARPTPFPFPCSSTTGICIIISTQGLRAVCKDSSSWR